MRAEDGHAETIPAAVRFRVDVARARDAMRIGPVREVDVATIGRLCEHIDEAKAAGTRRVILDLRATTFVDSTVLHLAVETYDWATSRGPTSRSSPVHPPSSARSTSRG